MVQRHEDHADKVSIISKYNQKLNLSLIRRKLSKLVSQLNTTPMPASRISYSPTIVRQRKDRKVSQGSVAASSDNDWGSDFEDAAETVKNAVKVGLLKSLPLKLLNLSRFLHLLC